MPNLLDQLRDQRAAVRTAGDQILTRAAEEQRDLTPRSWPTTAPHRGARELDDRIEALLADQLAELRAAQVRQPAAPVPADPIGRRRHGAYDRQTLAIPRLLTEGSPAWNRGRQHHGRRHDL